MELDRKVEDARDVVTPQERNQKGEGVEFTEPVKFLSSVSFSEVPETPVLLAQNSATSISLLNAQRVRFTNTGSVTVTAFTNGQEGQFVTILGDGFTTLANNTVIKTNTGAGKLLVVNQIYGFVLFNAVWIEFAGTASTSAGVGLLLTGSTISNLYVGKHVTILSASKTHTQNLGSGYDVFGDPSGGTNPTAQVVVNLTGMTQYRISAFCTALTSVANLRLGHSTNGSSWSDVAALTISPAAGGFAVSAFGTLPVGARIATCYLSLFILQNSNGNTATLDNFSAEFTP